ncbi:MAG: hypothetical protein R3C49_16510 [Planctomycetaceae bacterium]
MRSNILLTSAVVTWVLTMPSAGFGQGLIFHLPEDFTGVEYKGEVEYVAVRDDLEDGKEIIRKERELTIKSVGREDAEFEGTIQPCRWIEIKIVTGDEGAAGIDPGPVGSRIYKVLVPESKVIAEPADSTEVPNIMLPIVKGYRRSGEAEVRQITGNAMGIYPTICQLMNYPDPEVIAEAETPQTRATNLSFSARHLRGQMTMERPESQTISDAHYWVSREVPFGLARWEVTVVRKKKESAAPRDSFTEVSTTKSTMSVSRVIPNAESELVTAQ